MILLLACAPEPGRADGTLIDARTNVPVADAEIVLDAAGRCPELRVRTDAEGRWHAEGLCGEAAWTVHLADPAWRLPEPVATGAAVDLRAWRAPVEPGVFLLDGIALRPLTTHTALDTLTTEAGEPVRFPLEIPSSLPRIDGALALLIVGDVLPDPLPFVPLIPCAERLMLWNGAAPVAMDPWIYLGAHFTNARLVGTDATVAPGKVSGPTGLRYLSADALPAGRYALPTPDGARAYLLDFGPATP